MDPLSPWIAAIVASIKVKEAIQSHSEDVHRLGNRSVVFMLAPESREMVAIKAIELFAEEWDKELVDKCDFTAALGSYRDQLKVLIEAAATEIAEWMDPEWNEADLGKVSDTWVELKLVPLPSDFNWTLVAQNYSRAIRRYMKTDPEMRAILNLALQERQVAALARIAAPDPGFDLTGYRKFIIEKKCNALQLAVLDSSTYDINRKLTLWNIYVPQLARESAPIPEIPPEIQRRLREGSPLTELQEAEELTASRRRHQSSPVRPVLEIISRNRQVVVLGDPGSGKTSLLKFLALRWAKEDLGALPLLVDLKEYVKDRKGILEYFHSAHDVFRLNAAVLQERLSAGQATVYLDSLDEVFDAAVRQSVVEEIIVFCARYSQVPVVVTSRKVGYDPDRLRSAGFFHATLEEFDRPQMLEFLSQWHRIAEADENERALIQKRLERALDESSAIRELAGNPLLLTMMAILNRHQDLPRNRTTLYREASRVLLDDWDARKALPVGEFDREDKEALLREIAGAMQQAEGGLAANLIEQSRLTAMIRQFLEGLSLQEARQKSKLLFNQLTERNFILTYAGSGRFSFINRTFLEYYCASWFVDRVQKRQELSLEQLKTEVFGRHWRNEEWHEVLRLIGGMINEKMTEELILFLMAQDGSNDKLANLLLAAGCLNEVRNRRVIQTTARELWDRFEREAIRYEPPRDYQLWEEFDEAGPTREAAVHWMAISWNSENALVWLQSAANEDRDWIVRRAAVRELARGWKDSPATLAQLQDRARNDENYDVRQAAIEELARGWRDDPAILPMLRDRALCDENNDVRRMAVQELARGWKDDPATLRMLQDRAHDDEDSVVRQIAVENMGRDWKDDPVTLPLLQDRARNDSHWAVRQAAIYELARGWREDLGTLPLIMDCARFDENWAVRQSAIQLIARGWREDAECSLIIKHRVTDDDYRVRRTALSLLEAQFSTDYEVNDLISRCATNDPQDEVRGFCVSVLLNHLGDDSVRSLLHRLSKTDSSETIRQSISDAFETLDSSSIRWLKGLEPDDRLPSPLTENTPRINVGWVRLRNIRMFYDSGAIELSPTTTLFLGENATGKSTLLRAIALLSLGTELANQVEERPVSYLRSGAERGFMEAVFLHHAHEDAAVGTEEFAVGLEIRQGENSFRPMTSKDLTLGIRNCADRVDILRRRETDEFGFFCGYGPRRFFTDSGGIVPERAKATIDRVVSLFVANSPVIDPDFVSKLLIGNLSNIRDAPASLDESACSSMRASIQQLLPDLNVLSSLSESQAQMHESAFFFRDLSDGYAGLLALIGHLFRHALPALRWNGNPTGIFGVALVDELDAHLHPEWQRHVLPDLRTVFPHLQIIATSHSAMVAGSVDSGAVRLLKRGENGVHMVADLPSVKGWRADQILTSILFDLPSTRSKDSEELSEYYGRMLGEHGPDHPLVRALEVQIDSQTSRIPSSSPLERVVWDLLGEFLAFRLSKISQEDLVRVKTRMWEVLRG